MTFVACPKFIARFFLSEADHVRLWHPPHSFPPSSPFSKTDYSLFENHRKKSHSTLRAKQAILHSLKRPKIGNFDEFLKIEVCGQIVLQDRSIYIDLKLVENANIAKIRMRHF